jgi:hypothetical protein
MAMAASGVAAAILLALAAQLVTACGDDDAPSGTAVDTGLPENQKLSSLSDGDVKKACSGWAASINATLTQRELDRVACTPNAISASTSGAKVDVAKCNDLVDMCVSSSVEHDDDDDMKVLEDDDCASSEVDDSLKECDATVGEYEGCAGAVLAQIKRQLSAIQCSAPLDDSQSNPVALDVSKLPACQAIRTKCPDVEIGSPSND